MALTPVQGPQRGQSQFQQPQKKSDIERVMEGLQIANGAMGMGVSYTTIQDHMAQQAALDRQQALEEAKSGMPAPSDEQQLRQEAMRRRVLQGGPATDGNNPAGT